VNQEARPAFASSFPPDPELDRLVRAFARGDYNTVRIEAPRLAERATDASVRRAALELRRRIDPDPLQLYLLLLTGLLLAFLTIWFYGHKA
jgi:hypothetical protein